MLRLYCTVYSDTDQLVHCNTQYYNTPIPQYCNTQYYIPTTPYVHCSACKLYITSTIQVSHKHHVNKYCTRKRSATVVLQFRATPSVLVTWIALPCFFVIAENWIPTKLHLLFSNLQEDRFCVDRLTYLSRRILHCWIWQMPTTDDVSKAQLFSSVQSWWTQYHSKVKVPPLRLLWRQISSLWTAELFIFCWHLLLPLTLLGMGLLSSKFSSMLMSTSMGKHQCNGQSSYKTAQAFILGINAMQWWKF